jgi:hypothetical protein
VIAGLGFGIASVSSTVNPGQNPVTASSIDPVLYPQIGVRYQLLKHLYVRADVGYYIDFETVTGMGIMTTLGVGYAY